MAAGRVAQCASTDGTDKGQSYLLTRLQLRFRSGRPIGPFPALSAPRHQAGLSPRRGGRCEPRRRRCRSASRTRGRPAGSAPCDPGTGTRRHTPGRRRLDIDQPAERAALDPVRRQVKGVGLRRDDREREGHDWADFASIRSRRTVPRLWRRSLAPAVESQQDAKGTRLRAVPPTGATRRGGATETPAETPPTLVGPSRTVDDGPAPPSEPRRRPRGHGAPEPRSTRATTPASARSCARSTTTAPRPPDRGARSGQPLRCAQTPCRSRSDSRSWSAWRAVT